MQKNRAECISDEITVKLMENQTDNLGEPRYFKLGLSHLIWVQSPFFLVNLLRDGRVERLLSQEDSVLPGRNSAAIIRSVGLFLFQFLFCLVKWLNQSTHFLEKGIQICHTRLHSLLGDPGSLRVEISIQVHFPTSGISANLWTLSLLLEKVTCCLSKTADAIPHHFLPTTPLHK